MCASYPRAKKEQSGCVGNTQSVPEMECGRGDAVAEG